ncbi:conserved hypothetical protein [Pseudomonas sp. 9AZ]|nr:conserved hypothetical protein [Pseudomonas sp. 9AZ]
MFIDLCVVKPGIVDLNNLVPRLACLGEDAFQRANQANVADRATQFFLHFADDGVVTPFAEFNAATNGAKERPVLIGVVELVDQYFPLMMKNAQRERANEVFCHE